MSRDFPELKKEVSHYDLYLISNTAIKKTTNYIYLSENVQLLETSILSKVLEEGKEDISNWTKFS